MSRKRQNECKIEGGANKRRNTEEELEASVATNTTLFSNESTKNRSGKINRIVLKNFMCHGNLVIDFNKNVNLLVGNNGSGKSAILTALIVGLGSKSSATSRCTNIAQLIKRGESSGSVEIHIHNGCSQGYDQDTYGREIIVQRTFSLNGSSTYRIRSASGQVISSSRKDLMRILLFMNIQVDNPVCVLNQDASRQFLKESDPKKRFQFFLKATQIDTVIEKLNDCSVHYTSAKKQLEYQKTLIVSRKKEIDDVQSKFDSLQSIGFLKTTLNKYKLEQSWLDVENAEKLHNEITKTFMESQQIYDGLIKSVAEKENAEANRRARCELLTEQINQIKNDMQDDLQRKGEMQRNISKDVENLNQRDRSLKKINTQLQRVTENINELEDAVSESSESQMGRVALEKKANEAKLEKYRQRKGELESLKANTLRDVEMMTNTKQVLEENVKQLRDKSNGLTRNKEKITAQIRQCTTSKNSLSMYGNFMPDFVNAIENAHRKGEFNQHPLGPIGKYIQVKDEKWKAPIEYIIRSKISSFIVNDSKDREVLYRLMSKFPGAKRCSVTTKKFTNQIHDIRYGKVRSPPNSNCYCVLDLIECTEPNVINTLIDYCKIERILVTDDEQVAFNLTNEEENVPEHLLKVFLSNPATEMYPAPSFRSYALEDHPARYLQVNMKQRKDYLTGELRDVEHRLSEIREKISIDDAKRNDMAKTITEKVRIGNKIDDELHAANGTINEIEKIEYPGENERQMLIAELEELKRKEKAIKHERSSVTQCYEEMKSAIDLKREEMKQVDDNLQIKNEKINEKQLEIYSVNDLTAQQNANATYDEQKAAKLKKHLEKLQKEELEANNKINKCTTTANRHGERISVTNTQEFLTAKIKETEQIIKSVADSKESLEYVQEVLEVKKADYEEKKNLVENLEKTLLKLRNSRRDRYQWLMRFKSHVSLRVQHEFNRIMKLRNYDGSITINHEKELLELSVIPRDKNIANAVSSANCLSGGERSFSTVAFLLALWSVVDSPFYFLDEYDVYTDAINRHYMTTLLLTEAKKKEHRQYTFLTPQDMSEITPSDVISIQRLVDPIRN